VDDVIPRGSLRDTLARLLRHMQGQRAPHEAVEAAL
jgi:acetyl-CoA carboxylase beta subunit